MCFFVGEVNQGISVKYLCGVRAGSCVNREFLDEHLYILILDQATALGNYRLRSLERSANDITEKKKTQNVRL